MLERLEPVNRLLREEAFAERAAVRAAQHDAPVTRPFGGPVVRLHQGARAEDADVQLIGGR